jgi:hypothetical protein
MENSFFKQLKFEIDLNKVKDKLFQLFCKRLKETRTKLRDAETRKQTLSRNVHNFFGVKYASVFEQNVLNCLEEKWTFLIKDLEDHMRRDTHILNIEFSKAYENVYNYVDDKKSSSFFNIDRVRDSVRNTFLATQIGFYFLTERNEPQHAREYFERAIELDENFCAGAHVGLAWILIKNENSLKEENDIRENKKRTLDELCKALRLVYAQVSVIEDELSKFNVNSIVSRLFNNFTEKQLTLKVFSSSLESNIETIRNSQCLMNLTVVHEKKIATRVKDFDDLDYTLDKINKETSHLG